MKKAFWIMLIICVLNIIITITIFSTVSAREREVDRLEFGIYNTRENITLLEEYMDDIDIEQYLPEEKLNEFSTLYGDVDRASKDLFEEYGEIVNDPSHQ